MRTQSWYKRFQILLLLVWLAPARILSAQQAQPAKVPESNPAPKRGRLEMSGYDNAVNNGLGHWTGAGLHLYYEPSPRGSILAEWLNEHRSGEWEHLASFSGWLHWTNWFTTILSASGGGPDNPAAFFPRFRYDLTGNLSMPLPGLLLSGGYTRVYFGNPVGGRVARAGAILYHGRFVFQGYINFYNARPGNHPSKSGTGAVQVGREGDYWAGLIAGGGREAWQTQGIAPSDVAFTGYSITPFLRKWVRPTVGLFGSYTYYVKHSAYQYNGAEVRLFWQF